MFYGLKFNSQYKILYWINWNNVKYQINKISIIWCIIYINFENTGGKEKATYRTKVHYKKLFLYKTYHLT